MNALMAASVSEKVEVVKLLLDRGADINGTILMAIPHCFLLLCIVRLR